MAQDGIGGSSNNSQDGGSVDRVARVIVSQIKGNIEERYVEAAIVRVVGNPASFPQLTSGDLEILSNPNNADMLYKRVKMLSGRGQEKFKDDSKPASQNQPITKEEIEKTKHKNELKDLKSEAPDKNEDVSLSQKKDSNNINEENSDQESVGQRTFSSSEQALVIDPNEIPQIAEEDKKIVPDAKLNDIHSQENAGIDTRDQQKESSALTQDPQEQTSHPAENASEGEAVEDSPLVPSSDHDDVTGKGKLSEGDSPEQVGTSKDIDPKPLQSEEGGISQPNPSSSSSNQNTPNQEKNLAQNIEPNSTNGIDQPPIPSGIQSRVLPNSTIPNQELSDLGINKNDVSEPKDLKPLDQNVVQNPTSQLSSQTPSEIANRKAQRLEDLVRRRDNKDELADFDSRLLNKPELNKNSLKNATNSVIQSKQALALRKDAFNQDYGGGVKEKAKQAAQQGVQQLKDKTYQKAMETGAKMASAAGDLAAAALKPVVAAIASALPEIIGVILIITLIMSIFATIVIYSYCKPIEKVRAVFEYALTGDVKNLAEFADLIPLVGGVVGGAVSGIAQQSELRKYLEADVCKTINPDFCGGSGGSGAISSNLCLAKELAGKSDNDKVSFKVARKGGITTESISVGLVKEIIQAGQEAGVNNNTIAFVISIAATESANSGAWTAGSPNGFYGIAQIGLSEREAWSSRITNSKYKGSYKGNDYYASNKGYQMAIVEIGTKEKLSFKCGGSGKTDIFYIAKAWNTCDAADGNGVSSDDYGKAAEENFNKITCLKEPGAPDLTNPSSPVAYIRENIMSEMLTKLNPLNIGSISVSAASSSDPDVKKFIDYVKGGKFRFLYNANPSNIQTDIDAQGMDVSLAKLMNGLGDAGWRLSINAFGNSSHGQSGGDHNKSPIQAVDIGGLTDGRGNPEEETTDTVKKFIQAAKSTGVIKKFGLPPELRSKSSQYGLSDGEWFADGPGHIHLSVVAGAKFGGVNGNGGGSSNAGSAGGCAGECNEVPTKTSKGQSVHNALASLIYGVEVEAFGVNPGYDYKALSQGHKDFLVKIAQQKGYTAYSDSGKESADMRKAFDAMKVEASKNGFSLVVNGSGRGYRPISGSSGQMATYFGGVSKFWSEGLSASDLSIVEAAYLKRAELSAPPGFSEHATGLAIDISDTSRGSSDDLDPKSYPSDLANWLEQNAPKFGFKLSYPKGSTTGAGYEPWHWRFEGNTQYPNSTPISQFQEGGSNPNCPQGSGTIGKGSQLLLEAARKDSIGNRPDGKCYEHVADYIDAVGFGKIGGSGNPNVSTVFSGYTSEAHEFADFLNQNGNASKYGLINLLDANPNMSPYQAPAGSVVVVSAGSPGTRHPTAGDISVADGKGSFYNGGEMALGGASSWNGSKAGGGKVLGIYVPK
jgi:D-alanyl-D-alanine carboxypeptidase